MAPAHGQRPPSPERDGASPAASPGEPSPPGGLWEQSLLTGGSGPPNKDVGLESAVGVQKPTGSYARG